MKTRIEFALLLMAAAILPVSAVAQAVQDWNQTTAQTAQGHRVGNPAAPVQLVEFVSYTCPHCAHYALESEGALRLGYVGEGKVSVEVRHVIRNPVDLAAALVTECGPAEKFFDNHRTMMLAHENWMAKARAATPAQQARWQTGSIGQQMQAIARDLDFEELMEPRGYGVVELNRCLNDEASARAIMDMSQANSAEYSVPGTPSFVLNGALLEDVHSWQALQEALQSAAP